MFERFTESARAIVIHAQEEALTLGHNFIGTEHLLLGLLRLGDGFARESLSRAGVGPDTAREAVVEALEADGITGTSVPPADALASIGIDVEQIKQRAEATFGPGAFRYPQPRFTPRAKTVLEGALRASMRFGQFAVAPEHILLGLIGESEGVAAKVLAGLGVNLAELEHTITEEIAPLHARLMALGMEANQVVQRLARAPRSEPDEVHAVLRRFQERNSRAYEQATRRSHELQQELVGELTAAMEEARRVADEHAPAAPPAPGPDEAAD